MSLSSATGAYHARVVDEVSGRRTTRTGSSTGTASLKRQAATGVYWTGASFVMTMGLRLIVLAVLARLLAPEEFGLVSTLLALVAVMQAFGDLGMNAAIIHRRDLTVDQLSSLFWLSQLAGVAVFAAMSLGAPLIVALYDEPRIEPIVGLLAARFLAAPAGIPYIAVLQRELEFRRLAGVQIVAAICGSAVALALAFAGRGLYALVFGELATIVVQSALAVTVGWRFFKVKRRFRLADLRGYLAFGAHQIGERSLNQLAMNIDYVLVGRVFGPAALGVYSVAFEVASLPTRILNPVFTRVALPVLARVQTDAAALTRGYLQLSRLLALIQFPILVALGMLAHHLVPVFLGPSWDDAIPIVRILVGLGALRVLCNVAGPAFLARGRADIGFYWALFVAAINVPVFLLVVDHGLEAIAWTWVALMLLYWLLLAGVLRVLIGMGIGRYLRELARPLLVAGGTGGVLALGVALLERFTASAGVAVAVLVPLACLAAGALIWMFEREFLLTQLRSLKRPGGRNE